MALVLPGLVCLASGFLLVSLGWSRTGPLLADRLLRASLSVGYGLGVFSVVFFLARVCNVTHLMLVDLLVAALLIAAVLLTWMRSRSANGMAISAATSKPGPAWFQRVLVLAFGIALCAAIYSAIQRMRAYPHGDGWDAFAIWNLHARFLFLGGSDWRDGFTALLPGSHPDYPLLLPAATAHFWTYLGRDDARVPSLIGFLFSFATVGVLFAALSILRGRGQAMLCGTALLATPFFIEQGTAQYADVPLAFFLLATVVLLCLYDGNPGDRAPRPASGLLALAGVAAAFAAWTKNEGLLFLGAIVVSRLLILIRPRGEGLSKRSDPSLREIWTAVAPLIAAIVPVLLVIAYFKHSIAPPSELFADPKATIRKLLDLTRYWAIIKWYGKGFLRFGHWLLIPGTLLLVGFYYVAGREDRRAGQAGVRTSILALALTLAGYFAVYLITPYDLYWHLRFSLTRLFLQLWPATLFLFFLAVQSPSESLSDTSRS
jgi:hypothetical protein